MATFSSSEPAVSQVHVFHCVAVEHFFLFSFFLFFFSHSSDLELRKEAEFHLLCTWRKCCCPSPPGRTSASRPLQALQTSCLELWPTVRLLCGQGRTSFSQLSYSRCCSQDTSGNDITLHFQGTCDSCSFTHRTTCPTVLGQTA